jgi:ABC-type glycerol-3-phosphate transport system substrate-binding protein
MKRRTLIAAAALAPLARPAIAQAPKKISFLTWNIIDTADIINGWISAFKATRPGVEVEWLDKKGPDLPTFYQTQLAAGSPPDIINTQGALGLEYAGQGALMDLTPMLAQHADVKARFNADYLSNWAMEDKNWMLPFYISKTLLFYNKILFKKAGVAGPPTSFDELMAAADKIGTGEQSGFITLNFDWLYWSLFRMNGVDLLSPDLKKPVFNTPEAVAVVERLAKGTAGQAIDKISWTGRWVEPLGAFASGRIGMLNAHSPAYYYVKGQGAWVNGDTLGAVQGPGGWAVPNSHGLGISKGSKNPELAWDFLSFITSKEQMVKFAGVRKILSANIELDKELLAGLDKSDPLGATVLRTQLADTDKMTGNWRLGNDSRVKDAFYSELQSTLLGRKDAKSALAEAERKVARELKRG